MNINNTQAGWDRQTKEGWRVSCCEERNQGFIRRTKSAEVSMQQQRRWRVTLSGLMKDNWWLFYGETPHWRRSLSHSVHLNDRRVKVFAFWRRKLLCALSANERPLNWGLRLDVWLEVYFSLFLWELGLCSICSIVSVRWGVFRGKCVF